MSKQQASGTPKKAKYLQGKLENVLNRINGEGDFKASIISTLDGFAVAGATAEFDEVRMAAISAIVQDASKKAEQYVGFKRMDEVSLVDDDKFRLVCREFEVDGDEFLLTVVVPPYKTYRRITNVALRELGRILLEKRGSKGM